MGGIRRGVLIGLACALATAFFFVIRFPYDRFRDLAAGQLAAATGAEVSLGSLSGGLGLGGVTLSAAPVTLRWPAGGRLELTRAALRPAWSVSWLRGRPALHLDLRAPAGRVDGTVWPGPPAEVSGQARDVALEQLPPELLAAAEGFAVTGRLDARGDLSSDEKGLAGEVEIEVHDGAASAPGSPVSVPFQRLSADLALAAGGAVEIRSAALEGPMVEGTAQGRLGPGPELAQAPLDVKVDLHVADPSLRGMLAPLGVRLDKDGRAHLQLRGTLASPVLR